MGKPQPPGPFPNSSDPSVAAVSEAYTDYALARSEQSAGNFSGYVQNVGGYLSNMATYEQRVILQPFYTTPFTVSVQSYSSGDGLVVPATVTNSTVTETLEQALSDVPQLSFINTTTVNVVGTPVSFTGTNIADPEQRMVFVSNVANTFMQIYATPGGPAQAVNWLYHNNVQSTYSITQNNQR